MPWCACICILRCCARGRYYREILDHPLREVRHAIGAGHEAQHDIGARREIDRSARDLARCRVHVRTAGRLCPRRHSARCELRQELLRCVAVIEAGDVHVMHFRHRSTIGQADRCRPRRQRVWQSVERVVPRRHCNLEGRRGRGCGDGSGIIALGGLLGTAGEQRNQCDGGRASQDSGIHTGLSPLESAILGGATVHLRNRPRQWFVVTYLAPSGRTHHADCIRG